MPRQLPRCFLAAVIANLDGYEQMSGDIASAMPDARLGTFIINDNVRSMKDHSRVTMLQSNNYVCIPATSVKKKATLKFLNWLAASRENHDLFEYGIEGKDWTAVGEDKYSVPEGGGKCLFPGYVLTWNPRYVRFADDLPEKILKYKEYDLEKDSYYPSPIAGFTFDTTAIQADMKRVSEASEETLMKLEHGIISDPAAALREINERCEKCGRENIRNELKQQIKEFLERRSKYGI